jgi:hypothetical protein
MGIMKRGNLPPSTGAAKKFDVNRKGAVEAIYQPLYDFQTYAAAGQTSLTFFALPLGQGGKTYADTNMEAAGALPAPKEMLVTGIQVVFFPGVDVALYGGGAANTHWRDSWAVFQSGYLDFFIGSKSYLTDAPIGKFSNDFRLAGAAALSDSTTAGAGQDNQIGYATWAGPRYEITPVKLVSNQNFNVTLNWPAAVATPSTVAARIGVILEGFLYRLSQ